MKKYLIRAGFNPLEFFDFNPNAYIRKDYVGGNSGNQLFAYGVMNALQTEDTVLEYSYNATFSDNEIDKINQTYDAYILPMADAFRNDYIHELQRITNTVKKLKIPVIVIGVGLRADYEPDFSKGFQFDEVARSFVQAVTEKGTIIGTRGKITAQYLSYLGFEPEKHFTPIGCPSLYTYGLGVKTKNLESNITKLAVNTNGYYNIGYINDFLIKTVHSFPKYYLVQQQQSEFVDMYIGKRWIPAIFKKNPNKLDKMLIVGDELKKLYQEDRVRYFSDLPSWINFLREFDFFVGNRFHGCVAAILAGLPYLMIPFNARTRELTEYHHLTCLKPDEIRKSTSLVDYLETLDFCSFNNNQEKNFSHYIDFLNANGLSHIFTEKNSYQYGESPLEKRIQEVLNLNINEINNIIHCYESLERKERIKRIARCNTKIVEQFIFR